MVRAASAGVSATTTATSGRAVASRAAHSRVVGVCGGSMSSVIGIAWPSARLGSARPGGAGESRDLVGEVDLAVVLGNVADLGPRVGDAPEAVGVAADAVHDQEGHAVLVGDVFRLHHADGLLDLISPREIGAEGAMHDLDVAWGDAIEVVVAWSPEAPLHARQPAAAHRAADQDDPGEVVGGLGQAVPVAGAGRHLRRDHLELAGRDQPLVVVGSMVGASHHDPPHTLLEGGLV